MNCYTKNAHNDNVLAAHLGKGYYFGDQSFLLNKERTATIEVGSAGVKLWRLQGDKFSKFV